MDPSFPSPGFNPDRQPYDDYFDFSRNFTESQLEAYSNEGGGNNMMNDWETREMMREVETPRMGGSNYYSPGISGFAPMDHTRLSPSNFDPAKFQTTFVPPRFITGNGGVAGPAIVEPSAATATGGMEKLSFGPSVLEGYAKQPTIPVNNPSPSYQPNKYTPQAPHPDPTDSPVYDLYGSSVVSVHPSSSSSKPFARSPYPSPAIPGGGGGGFNIPPFDPAALGLPIPPDKSLGETNWKGLYSSSGFDLLGVLARVASRPRPVINIGPIDTGCSFLVCDATKYDQPIVYASATFEAMTGYESKDILGQNCRFLQSPHEVLREGAPRHFTDSAASWHIKKHITTFRESQTSLINYKKDGTPFINLVTIIPITWDTDEIAYFVGLQVDLVEQPSAILSRMKNGTFCVNYSLLEAGLQGNPSYDPAYDEKMDYDSDPERLSRGPMTAPVDMEVETATALELINTVSTRGLRSVNIGGTKTFNQLMFDQSNDLVHVISLKGTLLYVSPSSRRILEYDPSELTGQPLSTFCHASDVVNVLRDLKDLASGTDKVVNLLYRVRRKNSGYIWLECSGRLLVQPGKGRKCVILVGRSREVYQMSRTCLSSSGGFGEQEFWSKLSEDGTFLYCTPEVEQVLGRPALEMLGSSIEVPGSNGEVADAIKELCTSSPVDPISIRHKMRGKSGLVDVVTHIYPNRDVGAVSDSTTPRSGHFTVIAQTNLYNSEIKKVGMLQTSITGTSTSTRPKSVQQVSPPLDYASSAVGNAPPLPTGYLSTYKGLNFERSDNLFVELEVTNGTSVHFEIQQLRLTNKKLREEKELLIAHRQMIKSSC